MQNIISIDPSLSSTAIVVNANSTYKYFSFFSKYKPKNKWCAAISNFVEFQNIEYSSTENFSENEILKLEQYSYLVQNILLKLRDYLPNSIIKIESYSQESRFGKYQDLVTFGTILRYELFKLKLEIKLYTPKEVKKYSAEIVYPKDTKGIARNTNGTSGGSFNKWDMFHCLVDSNETSELAVYCRANKDIITVNKSVPKPLEDLVDAYFLNII